MVLDRCGYSRLFYEGRKRHRKLRELRREHMFDKTSGIQRVYEAPKVSRLEHPKQVARINQYWF